MNELHCGSFLKKLEKKGIYIQFLFLVPAVKYNSNIHNFRVIEPRPATFDELSAFHSSDYLEFLKKISELEDEEKYDEEAQNYGLSMLFHMSSSVFNTWFFFTY